MQREKNENTPINNMQRTIINWECSNKSKRKQLFIKGKAAIN